MDFELKPPPKLERLSPETLANISDDDLESALVGYLFDHMLPAVDDRGAVAALPPALQAWYVAFIVDAEVLNGGFNQFFFNSSGALAPLAPAAFTQIGIPEAGELVRRALERLDTHAPVLEAAEQEGTIEAFMETYVDQPFEELDNEYSTNEGHWREARIRFLRRQGATFRHP